MRLSIEAALAADSRPIRTSSRRTPGGIFAIRLIVHSPGTAM
jgi:hypothetical protein